MDNLKRVRQRNYKLKKELQATQKELAETKKNLLLLQKLNEEKDVFFSIIAHDLKSPFNGFLGLTEYMVGVVDQIHNMSLAEIQGIFVPMRNSATKLYELLLNLLDWARLQRGAIIFNPEQISLMIEVEENTQSILESARKKEIEIKYDIPLDLVALADRNMLRTVVHNLVSNAVKFTQKGGTITIGAKNIDSSLIEISVKDTGIGMNSLILDNLFRLDVSTNRLGTDGEHSTGLGLILCKEFVERNNGIFRATSEEGIGSEFCFTLPISVGK